MKVGLTPLIADTVTLRDDGVLMRGDEPFYDFDTGDPVRVASTKVDAVLEALRKSGALSTRDRIFGVDIGDIPRYNGNSSGWCGAPQFKAPRNNKEVIGMARRSFVETFESAPSAAALADLVTKELDEPVTEPEAKSESEAKQKPEPVKRRGRPRGYHAPRDTGGKAQSVKDVVAADVLAAAKAFAESHKASDLEALELRIQVARAVI
jgi:hypothetical protein